MFRRILPKPVHPPRRSYAHALALALYTSAAGGCGPDHDAPAGAVPGIDTASLASGPHSRSRAVMERTIFGIDVLAVDLWLGRELAAGIERQAAGREYSEALADSIAAALITADDALVRARIEYGVSMERFLEDTGKNLERAVAAGLVARDLADRVRGHLPAWFEFLSQRGLEEGDFMVTRIRGDTVRTIYHTHEGLTLLDQTDPHGVERWIATMASYLAPESELREPLIQGLIEEE